MAAVALPKDDWTPDRLRTHRQWRAKMYSQPVPKPDALAEKLEVAVADPARLAMENRIRELEESLECLREEVLRSRRKKSLAEEVVEESQHYKLEQIILVVAKYFKLTPRDLKSARRTAGVVIPRQIAMYLCKTLTVRSLPEIGRHLGGRDHTTVLHGVRKIESRLKADAALCQEVAELEALFA